MTSWQVRKAFGEQMFGMEDIVNTLSISTDHLKDIVDNVLNASKLQDEKVELQQQTYEVSRIFPDSKLNVTHSRSVKW